MDIRSAVLSSIPWALLTVFLVWAVVGFVVS
jgi:hypothetical protein